jgi:hypothetical protein
MHNECFTSQKLCSFAQCHSIVYGHIPATYTHSFPALLSAFQSPRLQLADEEAGSEQAHALGQDVLGEDVDERRQEDEGHGGLVDEKEGDELGHRRLEDSLSLQLAFFPFLASGACPNLTICCDPISVFLFWLAMRAGRAIIDGRAAAGARNAAALAKGRRKRAFMVGYLEFCGSARCCRGSIGRYKACERGIDALDEVFGARRDER